MTKQQFNRFRAARIALYAYADYTADEQAGCPLQNLLNDLAILHRFANETLATTILTAIPLDLTVSYPEMLDRAGRFTCRLNDAVNP